MTGDFFYSDQKQRKNNIWNVLKDGFAKQM